MPRLSDTEDHEAHPSPLTEEARRLILDAMVELGISQRAMAQQSEVALSTLQEFLTGRTSPRIETVERMFEALGLKPHLGAD